MAASSRPDLIDPALLRPGRLDKPLYCHFPDEKERLMIYQSVSRKFTNLDKSDDSIDRCMENLAKEYTSFTGADIQALLYSAKLAAVHDKSDVITATHLKDAAKLTRPSVSPADRSKFLKIYAKYRDKELETSETSESEKNKKNESKQNMNMTEMLGKLASFGYDIDDIKKNGKQRLATA
jgi:peroxin-1